MFSHLKDKDLSYDIRDLHGKTLKIYVTECLEGIVVAGQDENGVVYILDMQINWERPNER